MWKGRSTVFATTQVYLGNWMLNLQEHQLKATDLQMTSHKKSRFGSPNWSSLVFFRQRFMWRVVLWSWGCVNACGVISVLKKDCEGGIVERLHNLSILRCNILVICVIEFIKEFRWSEQLVDWRYGTVFPKHLTSDERVTGRNRLEIRYTQSGQAPVAYLYWLQTRSDDENSVMWTGPRNSARCSCSENF